MKQTSTFSMFCDAFRNMGRGEQFSYDGKRALYDYLTELEDMTGEDSKLDVIGLCCEFSEYETAIDCIEDCGYDWEPDDDDDDDENEDSALEYLRENTTVIEFNGGIIIQSF